MSATDLTTSSSWLQSPLVQNSGKDSQTAGSSSSISRPQDFASTPQNPVPPTATNPAVPGQETKPAQQNPPPSAQLPELPIKDPEVQPAPRPAVATPSLTIPHLQRPPALEEFLSMEPKGEIGQQMAMVAGFTQRNPHDGEAVSEPTAAYLGYDQKNL